MSMHIPQSAEYALRAMTYIANLPDGHPVRARDLSLVAGVPAPYLAKLMRQLVLAGLLHSQRGHHGGFVLALQPKHIRFLDIMRAVDGGPDPTRCGFGWGRCRASEPCPMHHVFKSLNDALCDWAAQTTLHDVQLPSGLPLPEAVAEALAESPEHELVKRVQHLIGDALRGPRAAKAGAASAEPAAADSSAL